MLRAAVVVAAIGGGILVTAEFAEACTDCPVIPQQADTAVKQKRVRKAVAPAAKRAAKARDDEAAEAPLPKRPVKPKIYSVPVVVSREAEQAFAMGYAFE